jgi:SAM-dependent methyltransferase
MEIDAENPEHFRDLESQFDTVVMLNVLDRLENSSEALQNVRTALEPGGKAIIFVPQHPGLRGSLDASLGRRQRYTREKLERDLKEAGFRLERVFDFNRFSVPGWWLNGKVLGRKKYSRLQLKLIDMMIPVLKRVDRIWPWSGLSLIALCVKD